MELGFVGLGRMGRNMVLRLIRGGHRIVAWNRSPGPVQEVAAAGATAAADLADLVRRLAPPRTVWVMVPAGDATEGTVSALTGLLAPEDLVVDGGNARHTDSTRRARALRERGLLFADAGTSGGIWGLENGYCLMVGGEPAAYRRIEPALRTLAPPEGFAHVGPPGAGHFLKMVHNGIEYGLMQAYAEGFELLRAFDPTLDLAKVSVLWGRGSVVRSWLLELAGRAFAADRDLATVADWVEDSGEGRWTVQEGVDRAVPLPVITAALLCRFRSRQDPSFQGKVLAALRREFGGHAVHEEPRP